MLSDNNVELIYVQNLCKQIVDIIREKGDELSYKIESDIIQSVKSIHSILLDFKKRYIDNNIIPHYQETLMLIYSIHLGLI